MEQQIRAKARQLASESLQRGDEIGWFETLYAGAQGNAQVVPWAEMVGNPSLLSWLDEHTIEGQGRRGLVVGCGLGDDAEELARRGFEVVAFDIAPSAISWCHQRFPDSKVQYVVADLLQLPADWKNSFDFIFEAYTLQVLPSLRTKAVEQLANLLSRDGTLLVLCRGRSPEENPGNMPWPLTRAELDAFLAVGLQQVQFEDYFDNEEPPKRRFRVQYRWPE